MIRTQPDEAREVIWQFSGLRMVDGTNIYALADHDADAARLLGRGCWRTAATHTRATVAFVHAAWVFIYYYVRVVLLTRPRWLTLKPY